MFDAFRRATSHGRARPLTDDVEPLCRADRSRAMPAPRSRDQVAEVFKVLGEASEFEQFELQPAIAQGDKVVARHEALAGQGHETDRRERLRDGPCTIPTKSRQIRLLRRHRRDGSAFARVDPTFARPRTPP